VAGLDDDETVVSRERTTASESLDEKTVATRRRRADISDTVVVDRDADVDEHTVVSPRGRRVRIDAAPAAEAVVEETLASDTVASLESRRDRTRKVVRGTTRTAGPVTPGVPGVVTPGVPGVLAGGRIASKPGKHVDRYPVRAAVPPTIAVVRQTVLPPRVEERRNLDAAAIAEATVKKRQAQAALALGAMVGVTASAAIVVALVVVVLSGL
jgi:hypothetical protein